ncbi:hypothetical protein JCM18903_2688 [Psychrobacter sp. JCM 18903]|nr:hypothetical protein JCM18903_2688 [Psychrobacter sp. JCM 18903]
MLLQLSDKGKCIFDFISAPEFRQYYQATTNLTMVLRMVCTLSRGARPSVI